MSGPVTNSTRRFRTVLGYVLLYALIWLALTLLIVGIGIHIFWGSITVDQMMMNLVALQTDGGGGNLVWLGVFFFGILPVLLTAGIAAWHVWRVRRRRSPAHVTLPGERHWLRRTVALVLVSGMVGSGTTAFATSVHVGDYIRAANSEYTIDQYYTSPEVTSTDDKRNLVMIYLESAEETLSDTTMFEKDPFVSLRDVTREEDGWTSVENFRQYDGGGWTMSGFVSTQCGVPLKGNGIVTGQSGLNALGEGVGNYLSGLTCVGDILKDEGYRNVFMGGASGSFAAKDQYLTTHGYDEQFHQEDWRALGEPDHYFRDDWGLSDERLVANAKDQIDMLHEESTRTGEPFNLSMLTVDTHEPVHIHDYCTVDTEEPVMSMFSCSMDQAADFVSYMEQQGYLEDTAVVMMGDHLKHLGTGNAFHEELSDHPDRTIFNRFWIPGGDEDKATMRAGVDQLDMMPTILEAAGFEVEDRQAGLGVSAFSPDIPEDSAQALDPETYRQMVESRSAEFYREAWEGEELRNG